MQYIHFIATGISELLWFPVLISFFRAWQTRRNPISLAICGLVGFLMLIVLCPIWLLLKHVDAMDVVAVNEVLAIAVALNFHIAFRVAGNKFKDGRKIEKTEAPKV